ncbi:PREDICTED: SET domain-containing protein 4-like, partial [Priapulus caudatus]|uniref:SET domain-containing protein 4-like n=1 Tax=Priapulus caudatus TaxID=37621 RepID=A0ABM1F7U2_PRICU
SVYMEMPASPYLSPTQKDEYGLAPYLDLLNHSETAQVEAGFNALSGCYEIRTLTPYHRHEQPLICYGAHDNRTLLLEYGFTLPRNPHGVVLFTL